MKQGWEIKKIGQCFSSINNGANIKQIKGASGLPITRIETISNDRFNRDRMGYANIIDYKPYSKYLLSDGDILMSHINSMKFLGRAVVYKKRNNEVILHGMNLLRLIPINDIILSYYAVLYFRTELFKKDIGAISHQSVNQASFNITALKNLDIPVPPLAEQERIVEILDKEFERIDALKANAEQNLQHAKDLFQSALKQELQPKEGWKSQTFSDEVDVINGRAYRKEELLSKGKYRVLRVGNFFTNDSWYYSDLELSDDKYCDYGDLLYAWSASFGPKIWKGEKVIYHYHIWKMVSKNGIDTHFLYYWLQSPHLTTQVMSNLHGTTMAHITKGIMESTTIQFPEKQEQNAVVARLDKLKEHCKALEENYTKTIALCDDMKQALLRKAFNGEL